MSEIITDELRWYLLHYPPANYADFSAIADRIDAEHKEACRDEYNKGHNDGFDSGFASADDWLMQNEDAMAEHGWVRKNKEHVISHATVEVTPHIDWSRMADELDEFVEIVRGMAGGVRDKIHHHAPTVEDVLRELEGMRGNGATYEDVVARCDELAKTLRGLLAGEDE